VSLSADDRGRLETALRMMLAADGFTATVSPSDPVTIEVIATDAACADCLVPKDILLMVLAEHLPAGVAPGDLTVLYPSDARA
jgi:hypothetical protein